MVEAVIFDMDGVLIDSEPIHYASLREVLARYNVDYDEALHTTYVGKSDEGVFTDLKSRYRELTPDVATLIEERNVRFLELVDRPLQPMAGVVALLEAIDRSGLPMAVASSSALVQVERITANLGVSGFFRELVSGQMVPRHKPAPDIYLLTAARLGVDIANCVVFEDSGPGVRSAVDAGAYVVAVPCDASRHHDHSPARQIVSGLDTIHLDTLLAQAG